MVYDYHYFRMQQKKITSLLDKLNDMCILLYKKTMSLLLSFKIRRKIMTTSHSEQLLSLCNDSFASPIVKEAIACYEANAYRATIVTIWTAVIYDCIGKLREMDELGVVWASLLKQKFDSHIATNDTNAALGFERNVLEQFQNNGLITAIAYQDLERLYKDRHRCAHPSMSQDDEIYQPTASQALAHIEHAVHHLIGQSVLYKGVVITNHLKAIIDATLFPISLDEAKERLMNSGFSNPSNKLLTDVIHYTLGYIIPESAFSMTPQRYYTALNAIIIIHQQSFKTDIEDVFAKRFRTLDPDGYCHVLSLLYHVPEVWELLKEDIKTILHRFVSHMPKEHSTALRMAYYVPSLKEDVRNRVSISDNILDLIGLTDEDMSPPPVVLEDFVIDKAVEIYINTSHYDQVCNNSQLILLIANSLTPKHKKYIRDGINRNSYLSQDKDKYLEIIKLCKH
jgi:hypothetical protein